MGRLVKQVITIHVRQTYITLNTRFFLVKTVRFLNTNSNETCDKKAWLSISTLNFKEALEGPSLQIPTRAVNIESPGSVRLW